MPIRLRVVAVLVVIIAIFIPINVMGFATDMDFLPEQLPLVSRQHFEITKEALSPILVEVVLGDSSQLLSFSTRAIQTIARANALTDLDQDPIKHFDNELINKSSERIKLLREDILKPENRDGGAQKTVLGTTLHTLQDFFAHTNWVDSNASGSTIPFPEFGQIINSGIDASSDIDRCTQGTNVNTNISNLFSGFSAPPSPPTGLGCALPSRCSHGFPAGPADCPGINKDRPSRPLFDEAKTASIQATRAYVVGLLNELNEPTNAIKMEKLCKLMYSPEDKFDCPFMATKVSIKAAYGTNAGGNIKVVVSLSETGRSGSVQITATAADERAAAYMTTASGSVSFTTDESTAVILIPTKEINCNDQSNSGQTITFNLILTSDTYEIVGGTGSVEIRLHCKEYWVRASIVYSIGPPFKKVDKTSFKGQPLPSAYWGGNHAFWDQGVWGPSGFESAPRIYLIKRVFVTEAYEKGTCPTCERMTSSESQTFREWNGLEQRYWEFGVINAVRWISVKR